MILNFNFYYGAFLLENSTLFLVTENDWGSETITEMTRVYDDGSMSGFEGFTCNAPNSASYTQEFQIRIVPTNELYVFENPPVLNINGNEFIGERIEESNVYGIKVLYTTSNIPVRTYNLMVRDSDIGYNSMVYNLISNIPPTQENLPYISAFNVTKDDLNSIKDFIYSQDDELKPLLKSNILGMYMLPFSIENNNDLVPILIDIHNTGVSGQPINEVNYSKNLGQVTIPDYSYNQSIGYKNIKLQLITPYFPMIDLDVNEVLGKNISFYYVIDILGGKATLNVFNDTDNCLISSTQKNLSLTIPYIIDNVTKNDEYSNILYNDTNKCYVKVMVQVPRNSKTLESIERISIGSGNQLIRADNPFFTNLNASELEQIELIQLLRNGVIL